LIQKAKSDYHKHFLQENDKSSEVLESHQGNHPKGSKSKSSNSIPFIKSSLGNFKAQTFCHFFSKIAQSLKKKAFPFTNSTWNYVSFKILRTTATFKFDYVSVVFVQKQLKDIKKRKSTGLDDLPVQLIKDSASIISKPLTHLINRSLQTSQIPKDWKIANLVIRRV